MKWLCCVRLVVILKRNESLAKKVAARGLFLLLKNKLNKERNEKRQKQTDAQVAKRNLQRPLFPRPPLYT